MDYAKHFSTLRTPQTESAKPTQVENAAGGFVFELDKWQRLDRFLILGAEGGTYYATEQKLVRENAKSLQACLVEDGRRAVDRIVSISEDGRAPKNDAAIFALAMAAGDPNPATRAYALQNLARVARIGTHLFHFVRDVESFRRWGRGLRSAVAKWYTDKPADKVAYQLVKYQQRDGWGHRDVLRLSHAKAPTPEHDAAFRWATAGLEGLYMKTKRSGLLVGGGSLPLILGGFEQAKFANVETLVRLIGEHGLTHEMIPNAHKDDPGVWEALLQHMSLGALVRQLGKLTAVGLLKPLSSASKLVAEKLGDAQAIKKARLHPIALLLALRVYQQGHGDKGKLSWTPDRSVCDALDEAFYLAFQVVEPTGKNYLLALDISGSMDGGTIAGCPGLTPRIASAAMAMATARSEKNWHAVAFTSGAPGEWRSGMGRSMHRGYASSLVPLTLSPRQRLDDVVKEMRKLPLGGTDCALPMLYAYAHKLEVDTFIVYTDSETWAGDVHPFQALKAYREKSGRAAKLVVVGMTSTGHTIADPSDAGMLDVVGFDTAAPAIIADFSKECLQSSTP